MITGMITLKDKDVDLSYTRIVAGEKGFQDTFLFQFTSRGSIEDKLIKIKTILESSGY